ncbi:hypothetical protein [Sphingobacterium corticibacter]|uniref:Uncharacterized protein n=1 Tax=Sphingobacterium corticibacter TaxID=2171749 RepID=A0A2T8HMR4_9SPHI|nr:hypothetical protein [Sphingobacterium corticibacter]PVH26592.1 hypothetical protein DC487_02985 [Sphingobacterium corticibacter]
MPTIIDFNKAVIEFYLQKKADNDLNELQSISPAKLKDLLLSKLASGELQKDIPSLEKIFNNAKKFENLTRAIMNESIDKFRPIQYFIQGKTTVPTDDTIILLSIFIDFQPRPYAAWREKGFDEDETVISDGDRDKEADGELETDENPPTTKGSNKTEMPPTENPETPPPVRVNWKLKDKKSLSIMAGALVLTILMAFYSWPHKQCMYWDGEKYIAIYCDEADYQLQCLALDNEKLENFKRITRKDTLTKDHVNKVWYSKIDTEVEFFTCPGLHPVHPHRSLKAATLRIIEKYAIGKVNNEKGAVD